MIDVNEYSAGNIFITGELGAGKTMFAIQLVQAYLVAGRPVATNVDIFPEHLVSSDNRSCLTRLPDKPAVRHFEALGDAYDLEQYKYDESRFGLIVVDECLTWLNSRNWQDKERVAVVDWFLHARKKGWNIAFLAQSADYVDKQILDTLLTYHAHCRKIAKYRVPFIGKAFGIRMPKGTICNITCGYGSDAMAFGREIYRGTDLYDAYKTTQVFKPALDIVDGALVDMRANYTILSAFHVKGRYSIAKEESGLNIMVLFDFDKLLSWVSWSFLRPAVLSVLVLFIPSSALPALRDYRYLPLSHFA